jgi:hypothetical protein
VSEDSEVVLGEIAVIANLSIGSELLRLFFTNTRIIGVHVGKRGLGALATSSLLGRIGGALEDLFKSGRESVGKRGVGQLTPRQMLALDKDNFPVDYVDIVRVELRGSVRGALITVLTTRDKLQFSTRTDIEVVSSLLQKVLGERVVVERYA